ncbi:MAG: AAA family ATPase, partial [Planctomycetes bacterium]|nr:AAA family ATPase [Planctomycetota bacterium]
MSPTPRGAKRLTPTHLRWRCPTATVRAALAALPKPSEPARTERGRRRVDPQPQLPLERIVGQERAVAALQAALGSEVPGFHAFVCGYPGSGRRALVRAALAGAQPPFGRPTDRLYVADFERPDRPRLLTLPRGKGRRFRRDLDDVLSVLRRAIPLALNEDDFVQRCERVRRRHDAQAGKLLDDLASELRLQGLIVTALPDPLATPELRVELPEGEPVPREVAQKKLDAKAVGGPVRKRLKAWPEASARLLEVAAEARAISRRGLLAVRKRELARARQVAQGFLDDLAAAYPTEAVRGHMRAMLDALGDQIEELLDDARDDDNDNDSSAKKEDPLLKFRANLFVDAKAQPVPPVVYEGAPSLANLCGGLDSGDEPAHLRLRAGSLALANHGVLIVEADELFDDEQTWRTVRRLLRSCWLEVPGATSGGRSLRPQPIRAALRVIVLGSERLYERLYHRDAEFRELFQVKVQLEFDAPREDALLARYAQALVELAEAAGLRRPDAGATAFLLEHAARRAADQTRLALGFAPALNLLREADRL